MSTTRPLVLSLLLALALAPLRSEPARAATPPASAAPAATGAALRIVGAAGEDPPVVNERGKLRLRVVDESGATLRVATWKTVDQTVARVTPRGVLKGRAFGVATIVASTESGATVQASAVVARVRRSGDAGGAGQSQPDLGGNIYLTDPDAQIVVKTSGSSDELFAGERGSPGFEDGPGRRARFNGPTGLGIDQRAAGGLYVADRGNNAVRFVSFSGVVRRAAGSPAGAAGTMTDDVTPVAEALFRNPRGVAARGPNVLVADTDNHAIYLVDFARGVVSLVAGVPGEAGLADGEGRAARFDSPSGLAINAEGDLLAVADTGNDRVRLVRLVARPDGRLTGVVTTAGVASSSALARAPGDDGFVFESPASVGFDGVGNVYVASAGRADVITRAPGRADARVQLAATGSLREPVSLSNRATEVYVLDRPEGAARARVSVVEIGPPEISGLSIKSVGEAGGETVVVSGRNFPPEARVAIGDAEATDVSVISSVEIRVRVPAQSRFGARTLTVRTRGGVAQAILHVVPPSLAAIGDGDVTTFAGGGPAFIGDGGALAAAGVFLGVRAAATDTAGNLYLADATYHRVRRVDASTGIVTTVAGSGVSGFTGDGGLAVAARLSAPEGVAVDADGAVYVADTGNHCVRRVDPVTGLIATVLGTGADAPLPDAEAPASGTSVSEPTALEFGPDAALYVVEGGTLRVARVDLRAGTVRPVVTLPEQGASADRGGIVGRRNPATDLVFGPDGLLYVAAPRQGRVWRADPATGTVEAAAGSGATEFGGDGDDAASTAMSPASLAFDAAGDLYFGDATNNRVRRIDVATSRVSTVAGTGGAGNPGDGKPALACELDAPGALMVDGSGDVRVAVRGGRVLVRIGASSGRVTIAGGSAEGVPVLADVTPTSATLANPVVACSPSGEVVIGDDQVGRIFVARVGGLLTTLAGGGVLDEEGDLAGDVRVAPQWILATPGGRVVFGEPNRVREVVGEDEARVFTLANRTNSVDSSGDGGPAVDATFGLRGLAAGPAKDLFIADGLSATVRRIDAEGVIDRYAGSGSPRYDGEGRPALEAGMSPTLLAVDEVGAVYFVDGLTYSVRRIAPNGGAVTTVLGSEATALCADGRGGLFVANGPQVWRLNLATGRRSLVAGRDPGGEPDGDGGAATLAAFSYIQSLAVDAEGNLFIGDHAGSVRVVKHATSPLADRSQ